MEHHISSQFKVFLFGLAAGHGLTEITVDEGLRGTIATQKDPQQQPQSYQSVSPHLAALEGVNGGREGTGVSAKLPGHHPGYDLKFKK